MKLVILVFIILVTFFFKENGVCHAEIIVYTRSATAQDVTTCVGACCTSGTCSETTAPFCSGKFFGYNVPCQNVTCPPPTPGRFIPMHDCAFDDCTPCYLNEYC